jgi:hypothetical protein
MASGQLSLSLDTSGVSDALDGLQPALQALNDAFSPDAANAWGAAVSQACAQAGSAAASAGELIQSGLTSRLDPIGTGFARVVSGLVSGSETAGQAFAAMGESMLSRFVGYCAEMTEQWAVKELTQTAATTAGDTARAASDAAAQSAGMAASAATALADIGNSAARAAAGAFAATASTPIVGPALAPAAAATALAAVLEFGGQVFSAAGGWGQVPYDGALTSLHKDEMVLPADLATPLRSALGGGASGGDTHHHWNIQAVDAQSFARLARSNPDAITGALTASAQRLGLTGGVLARGLR